MEARVTELNIRSIDPNQWHREVISAIYKSLDGPSVNYDGEVLRSESQQTSIIEFEFKTHPFSPANIQIPLSVSAPASVRVRVNDQLAAALELGTLKDTVVLHVLEVNVTKETEPRKFSRLGLRVSFGGHTGSTTLLLGDDKGERKPCVRQEWSWRYALQSLAFFALACANILGLAILLLVHIRALGDTLRLYAVVTMVGAWCCGVLGISDLAKIPFWSILRKLYSRTRPYRTVSLGALVLLSLLVGSGTGIVFCCLRIRQHYSDLISRAMAMDQGPAQDAVIRQAFVLQPWRREAQMLFERRAWFLRRDDTKGFRQHVRQFVSEADVKQAIASSSTRRDLPFYFDKDADSAFNDPILWYASLLPEADEGQQHAFEQMAVDILDARNATDDAEAKILRTYLLIGIAIRTNNEAAESEHVAELQGLLSQYGSYQKVSATQTYQMGCDRLGSYNVMNCRPEEASKWFGRELDARSKEQLASDLPLWQRPPEKLVLYHMFLHEINSPGSNEQNATTLLQGNFGCEHPYEKDFEAAVFARYPAYQKLPEWFKGTVLLDRSSFDPIINRLLNRGWRY